jgi:two-component system chemotaxis response regulator CheY
MNQKHILIVDDDETALRLLKILLNVLLPDYQIIELNDGWTALAQLHEQPIDLIMTDYEMPKLNGLDLARAARQICPQTPIILMTGYLYDDLKTEVEAMQLNGFLAKPFTTWNLREVLVANQMLGSLVGQA